MGDSGSRVQVFCSAGNVQAASVSSAWTDSRGRGCCSSPGRYMRAVCVMALCRIPV